MRSIISVLFATVCINAVTSLSMAPLNKSPNSAIIQNQYIVVLRKPETQLGTENCDERNQIAEAHAAWLSEKLSALDDGSRVIHNLHISDFIGYGGKFSEAALNIIRASPDVDYVEHDQVMSIRDPTMPSYQLKKSLVNVEMVPNFPPLNDQTSESSIVNKDPTAVEHDSPWGLTRISHQDMPPNNRDYLYPKSSGQDVTIYIVDTGIHVTHNDFTGRASWGKCIPDGDTETDAHGHGTHCAGIAAGNKYGVAKNAKLVAVKVLGSDGYGSNIDVIKGVEFVLTHHKKRGPNAKSVANMSLGGAFSISLNSAVNAAVDNGVMFAVAGGNDSSDACYDSPASAEKATTVGATDVEDSFASFSNFGKCIDVNAPGVDILSTWKSSDTATAVHSGTSMASPHVAGILALFHSQGKYTPLELKAQLIKSSIKNKLELIKPKTPNLLASDLNLLI